LQRTAKKDTKNDNTHAQPLFWSLNLSNVAVAVMVFLNPLISSEGEHPLIIILIPSQNLTPRPLPPRKKNMTQVRTKKKD